MDRRGNYNPEFTDAAGRVKKTTGWEFVHIAIDDCTRLADAEVLADEKATTAISFLRRALAFFERHGIKVEQLLTDNGSAYRSTVHAIARRTLGIRHLRTRPYRPRTNGRIERFIRTMLGGWAYGAIYRTSTERTAALDGWLWHYNHQRNTQPSATTPPPLASPSEPTCSGLTPRVARNAAAPTHDRPRWRRPASWLRPPALPRPGPIR